MKKLIASVCAWVLFLAVAAHAQVPGGSPVANPVPINQGGCGATTLPGCRANLGITYGGVVKDLRADFSAKCDGLTNDTTALTAAVTFANASSVPVTITFPGPSHCVITPTAYQMSQVMSLQGVNNGGLVLASGSDISSLTLFKWQTNSGNIIWINNFTLDLNGATVASGTGAPFYFGANQSVNMDHSSIINGGTITTGAVYLAVQGYGLNQGNFTYNTISMNAAQSPHNQCFNIGETSYPSVDVQLVGNHCVNTAIGVFGALVDRILVSGNIVDGWGYGAGVTVELVSPDSDSATRSMVVSDNIIRNSLAQQDASNTWLDGMEVGYNGMEVEGNTVISTCGQSISFYGSVHIHGNHFRDAGTCNHSIYYNSCITAEAAENTGSNSFIDDNDCTDDGNGHTSYGYSDIAGISGVVLGVNNFQPANGMSGAYNIVAGTTFAAGQKDNRIGNACAAIDQTNAGSAISATGYVADGWKFAASSTGINVKTASVTTMGQCKNNGLFVTVGTQTTPSAAQIWTLDEYIIGNDVNDFGYAQAYAQNVVFAFCAKTNLSPPNTFSWHAINTNAPESYVQNYTIAAAANTKQCFSAIIPADTADALANGTTATYRIGFDLGTGSNSLTAPGVWTSGTKIGSTTASELIAQATGTTLVISDLRLLPASADEGWVPRTNAEELQWARRFYQTTFPSGTAPAQNAGLTGAICATNPIAVGEPSALLQFGTQMNTSPSVTTYNPSASNANWRDTTASADVTVSVPSNGTGINGVLIGTGATVTTLGDVLCIHAVLNSRL